ncbi:MATE family efflux transporter [Endobacter medicaginis]|nr:MATE family efflux transporter [Endobacter medicaginis]
MSGRFLSQEPTTISRLRTELAALVPLALPLIAGQLCAMGGGVVDTLLAGHLGRDILAAVALGQSMWSLLMVGGSLGLMMSMQPSVAQLDGAGRRAEVWPVVQQGILLGAGAGVLLAIVQVVLAPILAASMGLPARLLPDVRAYLYASAASLPAFGVLFACRGASEGMSVTRPSMLSALAGLLMVPVVGYPLMYGLGPIPRLAAFGSGLTLSVVTTIQAIGMVVWMYRARRTYPGLDRSRGGWRPDRRTIGALVRIGVPMGLMLAMEVGMFSASTLLIGRLGPVPVAAHSIALNVTSLLYMVPLGLSMAVTVRVGRAVGEGDRRGTRIAGLAGYALVALTQCVVVAINVLLGRPIAWLYTDDPSVVALTATLLLCAALFSLSDGLQGVSAAALRGMKDTRVPMLIAALAYWGIGLPCGAWLAIGCGYGAPGMWIGLTSGLSFAAVLLTVRFLRATG